MGVVYTQWFLLEFVSLNFHFLCQFNALFAIAGSSPQELFHLPKHFITSHTTHLCCSRPVVAEESCAKPSVDSGTLPCPWAPGPSGNVFIFCFFLNEIQNSFNHAVPMWTKETKVIRSCILPGSQLSLQIACVDDPNWSLNMSDASLGLLCPWDEDWCYNVTQILGHFWYSPILLFEVCIYNIQDKFDH